MRFPLRTLLCGAALATSLLAAGAMEPTPADRLAPPQSFDGIADTAARSAALFTELGKVLTNPRCVNCHPASDRPRQGETGRPHQPPVTRGADGMGADNTRCPTCHQDRNYDPGRVPGHPEWHLAPPRDGLGGQVARADLHPDQGPRTQRPAHARRPDRPYRPGQPGRLGLGSGCGPSSRSGQPGGGGRPRRRLVRERSGLPGLLTGTAYPRRAGEDGQRATGRGLHSGPNAPRSGTKLSSIGVVDRGRAVPYANNLDGGAHAASGPEQRNGSEKRSVFNGFVGG